AALAPDREATLDVFAPVACADKLALFAGRGCHKVREFARMHIDLSQPVRPPSWPDGLTVRTFRRGRDEAAVHDAMDEAFREHFRATSMSLADWSRYLYGNPHFDPGLWNVAWDGGQVAGACLGYYYPDRRSGYIDELGVLPAWRRRGLGSALLLATLVSLRERGARDAVLGVDTRNVTGALHVYEAAGMTRRLLTHVYTKQVPAPLRQT
ncbi:MAG: GNAT family N-acetyltransferase, partial [Actinobacteria bacterium]|nr:GNAT family N-acetyltransferase [Actinomycetota bacterium]